jgi:carboxylesterase
MIEPQLVNAHLDGTPFFWEGGQVGVLLLHGLTATTAEVRLLGQDLFAHGYTVMAPLLPGHGTTPDDLNEQKWEDWAWEAEKSLQHLLTICDDVFVAGESMGGALALYLATRFAEIAGVVCYAPAVQLNMTAVQLVQLRAFAPFKESLPKEKDGYNPFWQGYDVNPLKSVETLVDLGRYVRQHLDEIAQPVLIFQGRCDETVASEVGEIILEGVSSTTKRVVWLENSAHVILLEDEREQIFALTREFLTEVLT